MTEQQQEQGQQDDQSQEQQAEQEQQQETPAREAARYRTQLRAAEVERDGLATSLRTVRQQLVEGVAELAKPEALWAAGVDVDELFDETGRMDLSKIETAVAEQVDRFGLAKPVRRPRPDPSQGSAGPADSSSGNGWGGAIRASRRR